MFFKFRAFQNFAAYSGQFIRFRDSRKAVVKSPQYSLIRNTTAIIKKYSILILENRIAIARNAIFQDKSEPMISKTVIFPENSNTRHSAVENF